MTTLWMLFRPLLLKFIVKVIMFGLALTVSQKELGWYVAQYQQDKLWIRWIHISCYIKEPFSLFRQHDYMRFFYENLFPANFHTNLQENCHVINSFLRTSWMIRRIINAWEITKQIIYLFIVNIFTRRFMQNVLII